MTTATPTISFTEPASMQRLEGVADALERKNFQVEILDNAAVARGRVNDLIPDGATVFTGASETLRLSGIDTDINASGRYDSVKARSSSMDRATRLRDIWRTIACPDFIVGSVAAVTETGSLVAASATGSQLAGYAGAAGHAIWVIGAQKVVPDLTAALRRIERHCVPLETERTLKAYGVASSLNRVLILNAEPEPGRGTVLLLREAIGF